MSVKSLWQKLHPDYRKTVRCVLFAYLLPILALSALFGTSGCTHAPVPTRVTFVNPPAAKRVCPDEPAPPGKIGEPVSEADDIAWQEGRDKANSVCHTNMHWLNAYFDWMTAHYPVSDLDIPIP